MGPRSKKALLAMTLSFGTAIGATTEGCRTATQMELDVTYNGSCGDLHGVAFVTATAREEAESRVDGAVFTTTTSDCTQLSPTSARIGTLVVTPNADADTAAIVVMAGLGKSVDKCSPADGYFGCIVARRAFSFVKHAGLQLEIALDLDCVDVPCSAVSTCSHKMCVDSNVDCSADGCKPVGVLDDGGLVFVDAPITSDAFVQQENEAGPGDAGAKDASADGSVEAGTDSGTCHMTGPLTCMVGAGQSTCTGGQSCCAGAVALLGDGGIDSGTSASYDCRPSGACTMDPSNPPLACKSARNCIGSEVCCINSFTSPGAVCAMTCGTFDAGSSSRQLCVDDCECLAGHCKPATAIGMSPPQTVSTCQ